MIFFCSKEKVLEFPLWNTFLSPSIVISGEPLIRSVNYDQQLNNLYNHQWREQEKGAKNEKQWIGCINTTFWFPKLANRV